MKSAYRIDFDTSNPHWQDWEVSHVHFEGDDPSEVVIRRPSVDGAPDERLECPVAAGEYVVCPDTSEIIGLLVPAAFDAATPEGAIWVMEKALDAWTDAEAIMQSPEVIKAQAIIANAKKMEKQAQAKFRYLEWKYKPSLQKYVEKLIAAKQIGGKRWDTLYGYVQLTSESARVKPKDPEKAVIAVKNLFPHAIKTTHEFQVSKLTAADRAFLLAAVNPDAESVLITKNSDEDQSKTLDRQTFLDAFEFVPAGVSVSIKPGAKLGAKE